MCESVGAAKRQDSRRECTEGGALLITSEASHVRINESAKRQDSRREYTEGGAQLIRHELADVGNGIVARKIDEISIFMEAPT